MTPAQQWPVNKVQPLAMRGDRPVYGAGHGSGGADP
jgi:hypothetical protein